MFTLESIAPDIRSSGHGFPKTCRCRFCESRGSLFQESTTKLLRHLSLHLLTSSKDSLQTWRHPACSPAVPTFCAHPSFDALQVPSSHVPLLFMGPLSRLLLFRSPFFEARLHALTQADCRHKCTISQVVRPLQATRVRLTSLPARVK